MPWKIEDVEYFKKGLTDSQKKRWVKIANKALSSCLEADSKSKLECEVSAVRTANAKFNDKNFDLSDLNDVCPIGSKEFNKKLSEIHLQEADIENSGFQMVLPVGVFYSKWYGEIIITRSYCEAMEKHFNDKVMGERVPFIDTEHDRGAANGWILDLQARDDGLYAKIEWTDMGKENISSGKFKYFSADIDSVLDINTNDEVYPVLIAVALCNTPVMNTMPQAQLSDCDLQVAKRLEVAIIKLLNPAHGDGVHFNNSKGKSIMNPEEILKAFLKLSEEDKLKVAKAFNEAIAPDSGNNDPGNGDSGEILKAFLKLSEEDKLRVAKAFNEAIAPDSGNNDPGNGDSGDNDNGDSGSGDGNTQLSESEKRIKLLKDQNKKLSDQVNKIVYSNSGNNDPGKSIDSVNRAIQAQLNGLEKANKQLSDQLNQIIVKNRTEKKEEVISLALSQGKIFPKDKDFWEKQFDDNPESTENILSRMPTSKIFNIEGTGADGKPVVLNETKEDKQLRESFGLSADDVIQFGS